MFNLHHVDAHVRKALAAQNSSISCLVQFDPRAGDELEKLRDTAARACPVPSCVMREIRGRKNGWQYAPPGGARGRTPAHLAQTVLVALTHARQHAASAIAATDPENLQFEFGHLHSHVQEALDHHRKYIGAIREFFPPVAAELAALGKMADLGSTAAIPERSVQAYEETRDRLRYEDPEWETRIEEIGELDPVSRAREAATRRMHADLLYQD